jgi:hypothetical protein
MKEHRYRSALVYADDENVPLERRTGDPHSQRIPCVCRSCNNEWMSMLQEATKSFLVPMLVGKSISLHRNAQIALAAWIATTMVAEFANPDRLGIEQPDRDSPGLSGVRLIYLDQRKCSGQIRTVVMYQTQNKLSQSEADLKKFFSRLTAI